VAPGSSGVLEAYFDRRYGPHFPVGSIIEPSILSTYDPDESGGFPPVFGTDNQCLRLEFYAAHPQIFDEDDV
jgi:hypothetical protein